MKQAVFILMLVASLGLLSGCGVNIGGNPQPAAPGPIDALKNTDDLANVGKAMDSNNPEEQAKALEDLAAWGAEMEKQKFDRTESVDLPDNFPKALIYPGAKVTNSSDNSSDEKNLNLSVTIKTLDDLAAIKDFYKKALVENGWKITGQSNSTDGANYDGSISATGEDVSIDITANQYSKIREIYIYFTKSPQ